MEDQIAQIVDDVRTKGVARLGEYTLRRIETGYRIDQDGWLVWRWNGACQTIAEYSHLWHEFKRRYKYVFFDAFEELRADAG